MSYIFCSYTITEKLSAIRISIFQFFTIPHGLWVTKKCQNIQKRLLELCSCTVKKNFAQPDYRSDFSTLFPFPKYLVTLKKAILVMLCPKTDSLNNGCPTTVLWKEKMQLIISL